MDNESGKIWLSYGVLNSKNPFGFPLSAFLVSSGVEEVVDTKLLFLENRLRGRESLFRILENGDENGELMGELKTVELPEVSHVVTERVFESIKMSPKLGRLSGIREAAAHITTVKYEVYSKMVMVLLLL